MLHCPKSPKNTKPGQKWPELWSPATHGKNTHTPTGTHTRRHKHTALLLCSVRCINSQEALKTLSQLEICKRRFMNSRIWGNSIKEMLVCWPSQTPYKNPTQIEVFGQPAETPAPAAQYPRVGLSGGSTWEKKQEHFKWTEVWFSNFICEHEQHGPSHNLFTRSQ